MGGDFSFLSALRVDVRSAGHYQSSSFLSFLGVESHWCVMEVMLLTPVIGLIGILARFVYLVTDRQLTCRVAEYVCL